MEPEQAAAHRQFDAIHTVVLADGGHGNSHCAPRALVGMCALCQCRYTLYFIASSYLTLHAYTYTCSASYMQAVRARLDGSTAHEGNALHTVGWRFSCNLVLPAWYTHPRGYFRYLKKRRKIKYNTIQYNTEYNKYKMPEIVPIIQ
ncbi:hypothetical protein LI328DRAFT_134538, partial [Trichoderma asperelloides]